MMMTQTNKKNVDRTNKKFVRNEVKLYVYLKIQISKINGIITFSNPHTKISSTLFNSPHNTRKTVRFSESNTYQSPPVRASEDDYPSSAALLAQQQQTMVEQDESLDRLSESIGRQRELSIQIGDELDSQGGLLEDLDDIVDRSRGRLDGATRRLNRFSRKAKENGIFLTVSDVPSCFVLFFLFIFCIPSRLFVIICFAVLECCLITGSMIVIGILILVLIILIIIFK
jgi:hypothetical protein